MRKSVFVILFSCLLVTLLFAGRKYIPPVKASSDIDQGDLVLTGNSVTVIEGRFDINGSIVVEENATLILRNALLNFTQVRDYQFNITFSNPTNGNPRLLTENATLTSPYSFRIDFHGNSSGTVDKLECWSLTGGVGYLSMFNSSVVSIANSKVYAISVHGVSSVTVFNSTTRYTQAFSQASVSFSLSNTQELWCLDSSVANVSNSKISWQSLVSDSSNLAMTNSTTQALETHSHSVVWLLNSTYISYDMYDASKAYVCWYLGVHVIDSDSTDIPSANVTARYQNVTVAESQLTEANGWTRLTLMENMMNATGEYSVGNHTVEATYDIYSDATTVNMTGNQQITLTLEDFVIPEFLSFLVLPLSMIATLLAVIIYRRKHSM